MKKIKFDNYRLTCGAIPVTCAKNDCNAFHYNLSVELTLDEQDRLAVSGKITSRIYALGYNKDDGIFIDEKIPFNDTIPSHVQKRLDGMGCVNGIVLSYDDPNEFIEAWPGIFMMISVMKGQKENV